MGKITKFTLVKEESQLRHLEQPISILMGRNLRKHQEDPKLTAPKKIGTDTKGI